MEKKWEEMSADEKQEDLFQRWLSPQDVEFVSPEAEKVYKDRITRIKDAVQLKRLPDRVPFVPFFSFFPAKYTGITCEEYMYDYDKMNAAATKTTIDFEPDQYLNPYGLFGLGRIMELLDFKQLKWPGHGVSPDVTYQFVEDEYMTAEEYDAFLSDTSDYLLRVYLPRVCGALEPLKMLPSLPASWYLRIPRNVAVFGVPEVSKAIKILLEAGAEGQKMAANAGKFAQEMKELGYPHMFGGTAYAPFDYLGDSFRGTRGIMLDMYRNPNKLLKALKKILHFMAESTIELTKKAGVPFVFIPLHKGPDGFMSIEQFKTFYWPTLRELMIRLIEEGLIPCPCWEGKLDSRLEIIKDIPKGKAIYWFEQTDLFRAKDILGDTVCIRAGVPASLLITGSRRDVKDYCKRIIDGVAKGGGFLMDGPIGIPDECKPENLKAVEETTKEYGIYR